MVPLSGAEDVLTVREIAAILKVVPATVYAMIEQGQLAHFRANNAIRIRRSELDRFIGRPPQSPLT